MLPEVNYFETIGFNNTYSLSVDALTERFKLLQAEVHPDKFAQATAQEKQLALQYSTRLNEAFTTLKDPILRAIHLLALNNIDIQAETGTEFSSEFLMTQMELREKLDEIKNTADPKSAVDDVISDIETELFKGISQLAILFNKPTPESLEQAAQKVRELLFYKRLKKNTSDILTELDAQVQD